MPAKQRLDFLGEGSPCSSAGALVLDQEMPRQLEDVLGALTQRRDAIVSFLGLAFPLRVTSA